MKTALMILLSLVSTVTFAQANGYAPTLESVVVLFDDGESEYSPFLHQKYHNQAFEMPTHPTCRLVRVQNQVVSCMADDRTLTVVGTIDRSVGREEELVMQTVKWNSNVELASVQTSRGLELAVAVKVK